MVKKTNKELVEYCKKQLGLPYWYGTHGQIATKNLYERLKTQPWTKKQITSFPEQSYKNQFGLRVHDCSGLVKGLFFTNKKTKKYDSRLYSTEIDSGINIKNCSVFGNIDTLPEIPGIILFQPGHIGVYVGKGKVIEARGHAYGVVETDVDKRGWQQWGKLNFLEYLEDEVDKNMKEIFEELLKSYSKEEVTKALKFLCASVNDDGKEAKWAEEEFKEAKELGITDGTNPELLAKRQEVAVMILRAKKGGK